MPECFRPKEPGISSTSSRILNFEHFSFGAVIPRIIVVHQSTENHVVSDVGFSDNQVGYFTKKNNGCLKWWSKDSCEPAEP